MSYGPLVPTPLLHTPMRPFRDGPPRTLPINDSSGTTPARTLGMQADLLKNRDHTCRCWPNSGQIKPKTGRLQSLDSARFWLDSVGVRPTCRFPRIKPKSGRNRPIWGPLPTNIGRFWPGSATFGSNPPPCCENGRARAHARARARAGKRTFGARAHALWAPHAGAAPNPTLCILLSRGNAMSSCCCGVCVSLSKVASKCACRGKAHRKLNVCTKHATSSHCGVGIGKEASRR